MTITGKNKRDFVMDVPSGEESIHNVGKSLKSFTRKPETRKACVAFRRSLVNPEGEETRSRNSDGGKNGKSVRREKQHKTERPASAGLFWSDRLLEEDVKKRPRSWEPSYGEATLERLTWSGWRRKQKNSGRDSELRDGCFCCCCLMSRRACAGAPDLDSRCSSGFSASEEESYFRLHPQRKCKSSSNLSKASFKNCEKISDGERDFGKVKRSLRLLGFELSDFGIHSCKEDVSPKRKPKLRSPTFSTKIIDRSISLDSLRAAVRRAWLDDSLDDSHRRLLAQAAYEEWYFTKERELREKRQEEKIKRFKANVNLKEDLQRKKEKSEEEFQKWLRRKSKKRKMHEAIQKQENRFAKMTETKEKSEKAFLNWKKTKDKEVEIKKIQQKKEEEKRMESERQKKERKIIAEKAFQQWKAKLEENEKKINAKIQAKKRKHELEVRRKRAEGSQISFQTWKAAKDEQIKQKIKQYREAVRTAQEERFAQMEERMYEAEQAFEDWLERVDLRKQKQYYGINTYQKLIPWIPA